MSITCKRARATRYIAGYLYTQYPRAFRRASKYVPPLSSEPSDVERGRCKAKCWRSMPIVSTLPRKGSLSSHIVVGGPRASYTLSFTSRGHARCFACRGKRRPGMAQIAVYNRTGIGTWFVAFQLSAGLHEAADYESSATIPLLSLLLSSLTVTIIPFPPSNASIPFWNLSAKSPWTRIARKMFYRSLACS